MANGRRWACPSQTLHLLFVRNSDIFSDMTTPLNTAELIRQRIAGMSTQVPTQPVFVTSGPTKRIRVGKVEIRLQHVCQRKLALAGRPAGLALAAMWYLGKKEMTPALIEKIRHQLGTSEFEVLKSATNAMPAWMSDAIFRNERTTLHG